MSSKRQRKKIYKKMGVWGFDAIVTGVRSKAGGAGFKHYIPIGMPVKIVAETERAFDCRTTRGDFQLVWKGHVKKIR